MTVAADFGNGLETRTFLTAYFALDVTNPEAPPKLLWSFADPSLGLSTGYPVIVRTGSTCTGCEKGNPADSTWFMLVGSGPTGYDGSSSQRGTIFVVDLHTGVLTTTFPTPDDHALMGQGVTVDVDLDY